MKERDDSNKDQIDGEQKHSEVFGDVHESFLGLVSRVCTLKKLPWKSVAASCFTTEGAEDTEIILWNLSIVFVALRSLRPLR